MKLFGRRWRVTVGSLQSDDVDIEFTIKRSLRQTPGTCELIIYNLTEQHRGEIRDAKRPLVRVEAGYHNGMTMLFQGNERQTSIVRDGTEWITKITASDGDDAIRTRRGSRSFGPQTQIREVVEYLVDAIGIGDGNFEDALAGAALDKLDGVFPEGTTVRGAAADELTTLLASAGLEWSVQGGVLQILERGKTLDAQAVELNKDSGMVGSPEPGKRGILKVKSLIAPDLVPGRRVKIESDVVNGTYRIEKAEYVGKTLGNEWHVTMDVRSSK